MISIFKHHFSPLPDGCTSPPGGQTAPRRVNSISTKCFHLVCALPRRYSPQLETRLSGELDKRGWSLCSTTLTTSYANSGSCAQGLATLLQTFADVGAPEPDKCEGPASCLIVLGIEIDTTLMQLRLPQERLAQLRDCHFTWRGRKCCTKRELLSLIGSLQHAAKVVRPGRSFIRRMIDLSTVRNRMDDRLRLNRAFRSDLEWWCQFMSSWNGVSILAPFHKGTPDGLITSDARQGVGGVEPSTNMTGSSSSGILLRSHGISLSRN